MHSRVKVHHERGRSVLTEFVGMEEAVRDAEVGGTPNGRWGSYAVDGDATAALAGPHAPIRAVCASIQSRRIYIRTHIRPSPSLQAHS